MRRKSSKVPSYCHHKASGQAVVRISGRDVYLGPHGSAESHERYERAIAEWRSAHKPPSLALADHPSGPLSINELLLRYLRFAENYYVDESGHTTPEFGQMKYALRTLRRLFGRTPVATFGPRSLKAVRQFMVDEEHLSRGVVNRRIGRIRRMMRWAVSEELAPPSIYEGLRAVSGLRYGRTTAREAPPIKPVPQSDVEAVVSVVAPPVAAMIQLQQLAAMRPSEVVEMRGADIDRSGEVWVYEPGRHKNRWRGHARQILLGPRAQQLVEPFLQRAPEEYLFSPQEAEQWRNERRRQARRTPLTPSQASRRPKQRPRRAKRDRYDRHSYVRAITYAIQRVNRERQELGLPAIPRWFPLQLRHSRATEIRRLYGLEGSQLVLGHKRADVTEVYAERNFEAAVRIAREVG